jgi:hypothetical protein
MLNILQEAYSTSKFVNLKDNQMCLHGCDLPTKFLNGGMVITPKEGMSFDHAMRGRNGQDFIFGNNSGSNVFGKLQ